MAASDVRAGRAFVELLTKDSAFVKGLKAAIRRVRDFAQEAQSIGARISLGGTALIAGLAATAKGFAENGVQMAKLRAQTGISGEALAGLVQIAEENEVAFDALRGGLTKFQKVVAEGKKETRQAFADLGIGQAQTDLLPLQDLLATVAERINEVGDESRRVAILQQLFGKSGADLLPVFRKGAAGMNEAREQARRLGTALSDEQLRRAGDLDDAFDGLSGSIVGLRNAIGSGLAEALVPIVGGITEVVIGLRQWIEANPQVVSTVLNVTIAVTALGGAVAAVATAVLAAISPVILITGLLAGVGAAALAVTDALGVTSTGFGELFNSIRVGGQGLATWMAKLWSYVVEGWEYVRFAVASVWDGIWTTVRGVALRIYDAVASIVKPIADVFEPLWAWLKEGFETVFGWIVASVKKVGEWLGWLWDNTVGLILEADVEQTIAPAEGTSAAPKPTTFQDRQQERRNDLERTLQEQSQRRARLDAADPNDGSAGVRFDSQRAAQAVVGIGDRIGSSVRDAIDGLRDTVRPDGTVDRERQRDTETSDRLARITLEDIGRGRAEVSDNTTGRAIDFAVPEKWLSQFREWQKEGGSEEELRAFTPQAFLQQLMSSVERLTGFGVRADDLRSLGFADDFQAAPFDPEDLNATLAELSKERSKQAQEKRKLEKVDVLGAFGSNAAELTGFGSSIEERQAKANEDTAKNTRDILDVLKNRLGAVFA